MVKYSFTSSIFFRLFFALSVTPLLLSASSPEKAYLIDLKCEYRANPLGIDTEIPRLSWVLESAQKGQKQTAYQILVASTREKLTETAADLWNSGKVISSQTLSIQYGGKPLVSRQICFWKVRIWDKSKEPLGWSETASWEISLLNETDWKANWINDGKSNPEQDEDFYKEDPAPLFRKEFKLQKKVQRARLYITGLGYYEAYINGERVNASWSLNPSVTI